MKNNFNYLTLLCLLPFVLSAQTENSTTVFHEVANRLESYQHGMPVEKLYVHQDRMRYIAGETVWFKVYQSSSPEYPVNSGVVYVDLVDGNNQFVTETKWRLENGSATGQITLPDSLTGGYYLLRAYTKWMQNTGSECFFTRELQIASSDKDPVPVENRLSSSPVQLTFFPEGGCLVAGIPSKVAFKAIDGEGNGLDVKGIVVDQNGNEIRRFNTAYSGQGYFYFEPEPETRYYAVLQDSYARVPLPEIRPQGLVLKLDHREGRLRISLRHSLEQDKASRSFYLTVHQEGKSWYNTRMNMDEQINVYDIPYGQLPQGIFTITIYDETLHAYCERLAFVNYPEALPLTLKTNRQQEAGRREKVTVELYIANGVSQTKQGDFSVAVVKAALDNTATRNNFYTDYFLKSELKGKIEDPASYFNRQDSTSIQKMDLLLLTHGWRRYTWENSINHQKPAVLYAAEPGLTFSGKVLPLSKNGKLDRAEVTVVFRHDSIGDILSFHPAEDGMFVVTDCHFQDTAEVVLSALDTKRRALNIVLTKDTVLSSGYYTRENKYAEEKNYDFDVEIIGKMPKDPGIGIDKMTYQLPDVKVTAQKRTPKKYYRQLHDEVFNLQTYKVESSFSYSIGGGRDGALGILEFIPKAKTLKRLTGESEEPTYFLDGMRVPKEVLRGISPTQIDRVELLLPAQAMIYGFQSKSGAIMFWVKDWTSRTSSEPVKTIVHQFVGYNQEKEFYSPNYTLINNPQTPDYRNTLYWEPNLIVTVDGRAEFSFFTSDDPGEYVIHCEGRSCDGMIGIAHCLINTN